MNKKVKYILESVCIGFGVIFLDFLLTKMNVLHREFSFLGSLPAAIGGGLGYFVYKNRSSGKK